MNKLILFVFAFFTFATSIADDITAQQCQGSLMPYPVPENTIVEYPDSLKPFYISHVGRHGSRYPASAASALLVKSYLTQVDTTTSLTKLGKRFLAETNKIIEICDGKWGELDSLGMAEQRGIAKRMYENYPIIFNGGTVEAISTYSPRAVMSMYSFTHQLTMASSEVSVSTSEGKKYSPLLRPFDSDERYILFRSQNDWEKVYDAFYESTCPIDVARRLVGTNSGLDDTALRELAINVYYLVAGMEAMGENFDYTPYMSLEEYRKLWSIFNLRQYLQRTATTISTAPAQIAIPLIEDIVAAADRVVEGKRIVAANLRFAHAETLMPLLSLIQMKSCYYLTHYFDQVEYNWRDFEVVPMAANLQFIFFRSDNGNVYVRTELNEHPVALIPGHDDIYVPWYILREYLLNFILTLD